MDENTTSNGMRDFFTRRRNTKAKPKAKSKHGLTGQAGKAADALIKRNERISKI